MNLGVNLDPIYPRSRLWVFGDAMRQGILQPDGAVRCLTEQGGHCRVDLWVGPLAAPGRIATLHPDDRGVLVHDGSSRLFPQANPRRYFWHPRFLELLKVPTSSGLKPFKVLRFMDWQQTNNSVQTSWSTRAKPADPHQTGPAGVALEHMINLCNLLDAEPWFCIPHLADADYCRQFGALVSATLKPSLRCWLEYSNELWNARFAQAQHIAMVAASTGQTRQGVVAEMGFPAWDQFMVGWSASLTRVVRVVGGQNTRPAWAKEICLALGGNFDAVSCGAYFKPPALVEATYDAATTVEAILADCQTDLQTKTLLGVARHADVAAKHGTPLVIYEGGQHLVGRGRPYQPAYLAAQNHPLMGNLYRELVAGLEAAGVELFCHYSLVDGPGASGSWGLLDHMYADEGASVKWKALQ